MTLKIYFCFQKVPPTSSTRSSSPRFKSTPSLSHSYKPLSKPFAKTDAAKPTQKPQGKGLLKPTRPLTRNPISKQTSPSSRTPDDSTRTPFVLRLTTPAVLTKTPDDPSRTKTPASRLTKNASSLIPSNVQIETLLANFFTVHEFNLTFTGILSLTPVLPKSIRDLDQSYQSDAPWTDRTSKPVPNEDSALKHSLPER